MYLLAFYYRNLAWPGTGGLSYSPGVPDVLLHTSLAAELSHAVPPQIPFLAGEPLSYHVGMDLVAAVLHRYGGVAIPDLVVRFCPTMFITIDVMAVFCVARRFVGSGAAAVVAAVLATLGEDSSFIPGILQNSDSIWSVQFFAAPTVFSLYFVNPTVMAHGLLFAALFCLQRSLADHGWGWIIAASLCSAALVQTKIFFFVQLILALWIALAWNLIVLRRWIFLRQCAVIIPMSVPLILYTVVANNNGAQISWMWSSGLENYVHPAFQASNWPWLVAHSIAGLMVYLALTYGFRLIGLGELIGSFRLSRARSFHLLLAVFVVLGPLLTLTSKLVPRANPEAYNNAIWFMVASKYVTTLFAVAALTRFWSWLGWTGRSLMTAVTAVVSLRPGQVAISRLEDPILALTALRIPYYVHFADFVANPDVVVSRRQDTEEFWRSWMHGTIREDLLAKYGVEWIVASRQETPAAIGEPSVIKLGKLEIEHGFGNGQLMVYRVRTVQR